jgi:hypothetical protein
MAEINDGKNRIALVLGPEWLTATKSPTTKVFASVEVLIDYALGQVNETALFGLFIPGQHLKQLLNSNLHNLTQVESINSYYNSEVDYQLHTQFLGGINPKLHFFMTGDLLTRLTSFINAKILCAQNAVNQSVFKPVPLRRKKRSKTNRTVTSNSGRPDLTCGKCRTIFQDPFQLACGHRQCRSCIEKQEG